MKEKHGGYVGFRPFPFSDDQGATHPLDFLERMFLDNGWEFSRPQTDSFSAVTNAGWTEYHLDFEWQRESQVLSIACAPALKIPAKHHARLIQLIEEVNLEMWFGHFELMPQSSNLQFRYGVPLFMLADGWTDARAQALRVCYEEGEQQEQDALFCSRLARLLEQVLGLCERYYPAFRYALAEKEPSADELRLALSATEGQA